MKDLIYRHITFDDPIDFAVELLENQREMIESMLFDKTQTGEERERHREHLRLLNRALGMIRKLGE